MRFSPRTKTFRPWIALLAVLVVALAADPVSAKKKKDKKKRDRATTEETAQTQQPKASDALASAPKAVEKAERHLLAYETAEARQALDGTATDDAWVVAARGWVFQQEADYEAASAEYRRAAELDPRNPVPLLRLGESLTYAEKSGVDEAYLEAEKRARALVEAERSAESLLFLGVAQQRQKRFAEAAVTFEEARDLDPEDTMLAFHLGATHFYLQRWQQAYDELTSAVEANPELALAFYYRGLAAGKLDKKDILYNDLDRFVRMAPEAPEAAYARRLLAAFG